MRNLAVMLVAALAVGAAPVQADVWDALDGRWAGSGEVRGMAADIALRFRPAFGGRGHHLDFSNRMRGADGKAWHFQAEALYVCDAQGACRGHWYDSRGMVLPLAATATGDTLVVEWGDESSERGRTTYALQADGTLSITDEVLDRDGAWRRFGETTAARTTRSD